MTVATREGPIAVVEVLGLPGSGKTTVVDAISQHDGIAAMSRYRSPANAIPYAMAALELTPSWCRACGRDGRGGSATS